ncbi:MFS transporter [Novosphingobium sp.]|uniref:MFS transporter n=1 Tax=Novosphingobium sp. TaxID=1874826 RepID=UPI00260472FD|nr:MFS transporter [Novosphingobium sp.]
MRSPPGFRWVIVAMLACAGLLNYVDRQTLSLMSGAVQGELGIDDIGYAGLVNAFLVAYMAGGLISAYLVDRFGGRRTMGAFVGWWSLASACSGLAGNVWQLAATRFAMGLAEAGGWVASPKLVREWFPRSEHALAIGIYSAAAHIGAALSPIVITALMLAVGWRWTFFLTGAVGLAWFLAWLVLYPSSRQAAPVAETAEQPLVSSGLAGWIEVARTRGVWLVATANSLTNPVWFFYLFWFPKYLTDERGLTVAEMGRTTWVVYAAAGIGSLVGGMLSGALIRRGRRPARARVTAMALIAAIAPIGALNAIGPSVTTSLALGAVVALCHTAWVTNQTALFVDLYPARHIGKVFGLNSILTGLVTMGSTYLVGQLVSVLTYRPMFLVIAVAYPLAVVAAYLATTGRSMAEAEESA